MRAVIDTNVLVSGLYRPESVPGQVLLLAIEGDVKLFAPVTVRDELARILRTRFGWHAKAISETVESIPVEWIPAEEYETLLPRAERAIRDASDAAVVATALLTRAHVVSGDRAFHPLRNPLVPTLTPRSFLERAKGRR